MITISNLNLLHKRIGNQDRVRRVVYQAIEQRHRVLTVKHSARSRGEWRGARHLRQRILWSNSHDAVGGIEGSDWHGTRPEGADRASDEMRARGTRSSLSRLVVRR